MISPVIFFTLVIGVIYGFQYFTEAYVANVTASNGDVNGLGAPLQGRCSSTRSACISRGSIRFQMGYASAMAWVLLVITMICTIDHPQDLEPLGALPGR